MLPPAAPRPAPATGAQFAGQVEAAQFAEQVEALQAATRVLAGVALRSLDVLDGVITLPQFRMLAVLAELGTARSARVARALSLDASTVTRLADRLVAAGHVARGSDPRHRSVVTLELTPSGAAGTLSASARSDSAYSDRRSECPRTTPCTSASTSIGGETSPVNAP